MILIIKIVAGIFFLIAVFLFFIERWMMTKNNLPVVKQEINRHFCILIPARDESKVISGLLDSIEKQTRKIDSKDIYCIVEEKTDPTVNICQSRSINVIYRRDLTKKRKGYALDDAVDAILKMKKHYGAYFIFDADNVLEPTFIEEMEKTYEEGYDIGIGYRNCKNGNDSMISACSALTFTMINTLGNDRKRKTTQTMTISGTGFYIRGSWIEKWQGYPFHSLTEDYELTLYAVLHGLTTTYNKSAIYYDEQPIHYRTTVTQRVRWIKGYMESRKKYIPEIKKQRKRKNPNIASQWQETIGVMPYVLAIVGFALYMIALIGQAIHQYQAQNPTWYHPLLFLVVLLVILYIILSIFTGYMIKQENTYFQLKPKIIIQTILFYPIYLLTYVSCAIRALLTKKVKWQKIDHHRNIKKG